MQDNTVLVITKETARRAYRTEPIYQYDVGHKLQLTGFDGLPDAFQVHFAHSLMGDSITQVGQDGVVDVPDMYAQTAAPIYAWVYVADAESGLTKYQIEIPVQRRARITDQEPTPVERSAIDQEIAALNAGVERAETAAEAAEAAQAGAEAAERGASAAEDSAGASAALAAQKAELATREADRAEAAEGIVEQAARDAVEDVTEVAEQAASDLGGIVRDAQTQIAGSVQQAQQAAQAASGSETAAAGSAGAAAGSATAADQSAQAAAQKKEQMDVRADEIEDELTSLMSDIQANQEGLDELSDAFDEHEEYAENTYAKQDGYYSDLTAGNAEQLVSSKLTEDQVPYKLRPAGGTNDIGNREYKEAIVGGTIAWNQLVRDEASDNETDYADVVTVDDAVEDAAGVKVKLEPVQDLHGYDHPWPAGGGSNIWGGSKLAEDISNASTGIVWNKTAKTITIPINASQSGIADENIVFTNGIVFEENTVYTLITDGTASAFLNMMFKYTDGTTDRSLGRNATVGAFSSASGKTVQNVVYRSYSGSTVLNYEQCGLFKGSVSVSAYTPYSNICPITGWDGVKVRRSGGNLWDEETAAWIINNSGEFVPSSNAFSSKNPIPVTPGQKLYVVNGSNTYVYMKFYDSDLKYINAPVNARNAEITVPNISNIAYMHFSVGTEYGRVYKHDIAINYPSTITEHNSTNTYDITLPTEAGTVYGGELTVNADGSGTIVQKMVYYKPNSMDNLVLFSDDTTHKLYRTANFMPLAPNIYGGSGAKSSFTNTFGNAPSHGTQPIVQFPYSATQAHLYFRTTAEANPLECEFVYELATPITYTLTATQVRTLLGTNNIWADTGDVALTYTGTDEHLTLESGRKYLTRISGTDSMVLGSGQTVTAVKGQDNVFDLTQMFGTSVADYVYGQGASYFRGWFRGTVYAYNPGALISVSGLQSHDLVGFNLWDEEWEEGNISNGVPTTSTNHNQIRSKNFCKCIGGQQYYLRCGTYDNQHYLAIAWYDADKNYISMIYVNKTTATAPQNASYFKIFTNSGMYIYGNTYNHDICINFSHNGSRNGEYEPYVKHSYPLDPSVVLRGIPKLINGKPGWDGDRYLPDGTVERRYGVVDLGSLTWEYSRMVQRFDGATVSNLSSKRTACFCKLYSASNVDAGWSNSDKVCCIYNTRNTIMVKDSAYTDAAAFKAAMSGVLLVYELATPTTETAQPYRNLQICDPDGTEEFVSSSIVPVGHVTRYPENLRQKIEGLPWNFDNIIAMTETGTTASKAYAVGDYFIRDSILYKATAAIASGGTITPGTNCTATTIMAEIKALA